MIFITESGKEIQVPSDCTFQSLEKFVKEVYQQGKADGYTKAIDDFVEKLDKRFFGMEMSSGLPGEGVTWGNARKQLKEIAEQLKGEK